MDMSESAAKAAANAQADLARAEAEAAALLHELEASDPSPRKKYTMPSPYAPGEGPPNPVNGVAQPTGLGDVFYGKEKGNWSGTWNESTLPETPGMPPTSSGHVDFAQKIKEAQKPHGSH